MATEQEWVLVKEAARQSGVPPIRVYRWVRQGRLASRPTTHGQLVPLVAVQALGVVRHPQAMNAEQRERHALHLAREQGHTIPHIVSDAQDAECTGTCTLCGDGVLVYTAEEGPAIVGTAATHACPGSSCEHGWQVLRRAEVGVVLHGVHCGAECTEG